MATALPAYKSALPDLMTTLMGQKQTTSGGNTTTVDNTTGTANTDPLSQIFAQQLASSTPAGMEAVLGELFRTGAMQVPELTRAFANATGSRSSNNSGLALALAELNKGLTGQAATLLGQQQAQAAQTANGIAQATRGTNRTVSANNPGGVTRTGAATPGGGLGATALGFALNQGSKLLDKTKAAGGASSTMAPTPGANVFQGLDSSTMGALRNDYGYGLTTPVTDFTNPVTGDMYLPGALGASGANGIDLGLGNFGLDAANFGLDAVDLGLGSMDWGSVLPSASNIFTDIGLGDMDWSSALTNNAGGGFLSDLGDFFGSFFADGGLIEKSKIPHYRDGGLVTGMPPVKKADGGVIRNKNNTGTGTTRMGTGSINIPSTGIPRQERIADAGSSGVSSPDQLQNDPLLLALLMQEGRNLTDTATSEGVNTGPSSVGPSIGGMSLGNLGTTAMGMAASTLGGPMAGMAMAAAMAALGAPASAQSVAATNAVESVANSSLGEALGLGSLGGSTNASSAQATNGMDSMSDSFGQANVGDPSAVGGFGGGAVGDDGGSNGGASDGGAEGGGGVGAANGGHIKGKGTGISDDIPAMLSDGEFVLSADVVKLFGADFFQTLQDKFHTPAAVQRATGKA